MLQEHYHEMIIGIAKGVDQYNRTFDCVARSNIINDIHIKQGFNFKRRTRYSVVEIHYTKSIYYIFF